MPTPIKYKEDISRIRLYNQRINESKFNSPKEVVSWMGAMQAQDFAGVKWAIGLRTNNATLINVEKSYNNGEILRTHLLRPTWHMVAAEDLPWLLDLTSANVQARFKTRNHQLDLTPTIFKLSTSVIHRAFEIKSELTRDELIDFLNKANIATDQNRASHLLANAELEGLICSGPIKEGKLTYALLETRIHKTIRRAKEEALALLAERYFSSRSPATLEDFIWWSGLSVRDARIGLESIKHQLISTIIDSRQYWMKETQSQSDQEIEQAFFLPPFDEFIISYRDRTASLPVTKQSKAVSNNGIFRATIVLEGQVIGIWKAVENPQSINLTVQIFKDPHLLGNNLMEKSVNKLEKFLENPVEIHFSKWE